MNHDETTRRPWHGRTSRIQSFRRGVHAGPNRQAYRSYVRVSLWSLIKNSGWGWDERWRFRLRYGLKKKKGKQLNPEDNLSLHIAEESIRPLLLV